MRLLQNLQHLKDVFLAARLRAQLRQQSTYSFIPDDSAAAVVDGPPISIVMPVYNPKLAEFQKAVESCRNQTYTNWELCIADDCSSDPELRSFLTNLRQDSRVKVTFLESRRHIAGALNAAAATATGRYLCFLDHDDELTAGALSQVALSLSQAPDARLLYSDEDKIDERGNFCDVHRKTGWDPLLLLHYNYVCHLLVFEAALFRELGGFRAGVDGAQDWDLVLRATKFLKPQQIVHIARVLYHWRMSATSTARRLRSKPYARLSQRRAVADHLSLPVEAVTFSPVSRSLHVRLPAPLPAREVVIVAEEGLRGVAERLAYGARYLRVSVVTKIFAERVRGLEIAADTPGDFVFIMMQELRAESSDWLEKLVALAHHSRAAAIGCRVIGPDDTIRQSYPTTETDPKDSLQGLHRLSPGVCNKEAVSHQVKALHLHGALISLQAVREGAVTEHDGILTAERGTLVYNPEVQLLEPLGIGKRARSS